jgi:hypothetical protein
MIECNQFEVEARIEEGIVRWKLETDLPQQTIVMIQGIRYLESPTGWILEMRIFDDRFFVEAVSENRNGSAGSFEIKSNEAAAIDRFSENKNDDDLEGFKEAKGEELIVRFNLVAYQRNLIDDFGELNCQLRGDAVVRSGGRNLLNKELILFAPRAKKLQKNSNSQQNSGGND